MNGEAVYNAISGIRPEFLEEAETYRPAKRYLIRPMIAAACLCLCMIGSVPALAAANNPAAYALLYRISPAIAQQLKPINAVSVDNGIEMRVEAANVNADQANILVSMRDTIGNRIKDTCDLFDSYDIHTPYDQSGGCSQVEYDAETGTATFLIQITQNHRQLIPGDKLTFSVSKLLSGTQHGELPISAIDMTAIPNIERCIPNPKISGGMQQTDPPVLQPDEANEVPLTPGVTLTGFGILDGALHVQLRYDDILSTDNHGFVYLKDGAGNIIECSQSVSFWAEQKTDSCDEYVFDVAPELLRDCTVWCEYWTCPNGSIKGNWEVTFPLTE